MNSRSKGKRGELEWRDFLRVRGYPDARRGQQYAGGGDSPDVVGGPVGTHAEVKRTERLSIYDAMDQAMRDAPEAHIPYVAHRRNRGGWLVVLTAEDFLRLCEDAGRGS